MFLPTFNVAIPDDSLILIITRASTTRDLFFQVILSDGTSSPSGLCKFFLKLDQILFFEYSRWPHMRKIVDMVIRDNNHAGVNV